MDDTTGFPPGGQFAAHGNFHVRETRYDCTVYAHLVFSGIEIAGKITNASATGIGAEIQCHLSLASGTKVMLLAPEFGEVHCTSRWHSYPRVGLSVDASSQRSPAFQKFIHQLSETAKQS
jgi:hypothetical protein